MAKIMRESGHRGFQVPNGHITGPTEAPPLKFVYLTIERVRQVDNPDGRTDGDFYAHVMMDGKWFAESTHREDAADVSPMWDFGLAYSANNSRSIPIRIEIWDHDAPGRDDQCDVNPVSGKRHLDLTYDPRSGMITGDDTGRRNRTIIARGSGDSNRVAVLL